MITSILKFKKMLNESLSNDRATNIKKKQLQDAASQLVEAMKKLKIAEIVKKEQNEVMKGLLSELNTHSIVCQGVLIQMIGGFESTRTDMKGYNDFVFTSIDTLGEQYMEMHSKMIELSTVDKPESSYIRADANKKNIPNGIIEGLGDSIIKGISRLIIKLKSFLTISKKEVEEIKSELESFNLNSEDLDDHDNNIIKQIEDENMGKDGYMPGYNESRRKRRINEDLESNPQTEAIQNTLKEAIKLIEETEQEKYYIALVETKKTEIIKLLSELNGKKYAIEDKILSIVQMKGGPKLTESDYVSKMSNAEEVGSEIADMAQSLFSLYTKSFQVSGSLRQYGDDTNLPDGTLGATFDYIFNTVIPPETNVSERVSSFLLRAIRKIKSYISSFKIASKRCDLALNQI
jgi:hypothetical protein